MTTELLQGTPISCIFAERPDVYNTGDEKMIREMYNDSRYQSSPSNHGRPVRFSTQLNEDYNNEIISEVDSDTFIFNADCDPDEIAAALMRILGADLNGDAPKAPALYIGQVYPQLYRDDPTYLTFQAMLSFWLDQSHKFCEFPGSDMDASPPFVSWYVAWRSLRKRKSNPNSWPRQPTSASSSQSTLSLPPRSKGSSPSRRADKAASHSRTPSPNPLGLGSSTTNLPRGHQRTTTKGSRSISPSSSSLPRLSEVNPPTQGSTSVPLQGDTTVSQSGPGPIIPISRPSTAGRPSGRSIAGPRSSNSLRTRSARRSPDQRAGSAHRRLNGSTPSRSRERLPTRAPPQQRAIPDTSRCQFYIRWLFCCCWHCRWKRPEMPGVTRYSLESLNA